MKYIFIFFFLISFHASSTENIRFIDQNIILNNSLAGKSIVNEINKIFDKKNKDFISEQENLEVKKKNTLSKKNILNEDEYKKIINDLNKEISLFQDKKQNFLKDLQNKQNQAQIKLLEELNQILADYSKKNEISLILKKENLIIARSNLDITNEILKIIDSKLKKINLK
tara:strand:+ start:294 stop:803 length:510 start_codon:yes stop_codon:yes gene_type:complete